MRLVNWRFIWKRRWYLLFFFVFCLLVTLFRTKTTGVTTWFQLLPQHNHNNSFHSSYLAVATQRRSSDADVIVSHLPPVDVVKESVVNRDDQKINSPKSDRSSNPGSNPGSNPDSDNQRPSLVVSEDSRGKSHLSRGDRDSRGNSSNAHSHSKISIESRGHTKNTRDKTRVESRDRCDTWCRRGEHMSPPYNLTAVLLVRIYRDDLAGLTSREMMQWLFYLRYAGVEHVYVYDAFTKNEESQRDVLQPLVQSGYVTYVDWSKHTPYNMLGTQVSAYAACFHSYGSLTNWHLSMDMDEYPFSPTDQGQNFLQKFLAEYSNARPDVSQILLSNFLFLGKPLPDLTNPILIDRIRRRTRKPANSLVKPVFKPVYASAMGVHNMAMRLHKSAKSDPWRMRMNHYWGARLQDWGENTPKVLSMTEPDFSIQPIIEKIKQCSKCLGEDLLYVRRWN